MFNKLSARLLVGLVVSTLASSAYAQMSSLAQAEQFRMQYPSAKITCDVALYHADELTKSRIYEVYSSTDNRAVVLFKSAAEAGQKVLINKEKFWMFMPKSRRPIRITPMQKLLGEASLGDVATLNWTEQYQVVKEQLNGDKIELQLQATQHSGSYQRINLTLNAADKFPLSADLYLRSGMLAKTAQFKRGMLNGKPAVVQMTLLDRMRPDQKTIIRYRDVTPLTIPDKLFNPQILLRSDIDQLLADE